MFCMFLIFNEKLGVNVGINKNIKCNLIKQLIFAGSNSQLSSVYLFLLFSCLCFFTDTRMVIG